MRYKKGIMDVRAKFPVGSAVMFKGEFVGIVVGYNEEVEEPEVIYRVRKNKQLSQFSIRSPLYRRAK